MSTVHLVRKRQDTVDLDIVSVVDLLSKTEVFVNLADSAGKVLTIQRSHITALVADGWLHTDLIPAANIVEDGG